MSGWFEELERMIDEESQRIADMQGSMEEKEKSMKEESLPKIMKRFGDKQS